MAKTKDTEVIVVSPKLQADLDTLRAFKTQVDAVGLNLQQIVVTDETSLAVCQQNVSKGNNLLNAIADKHSEVKAPHLNACRLIDSIKKDLSEELTKGITHGKGQVKLWEEARIAENKAKQDEIDRIHAEKVAQEKKEADRKETIRAYIRDKATPLLQKMYAECTTVEICNQKLQSIEKNYKERAFFQEFESEAYELRDNYVNLIIAKRAQLAKADTMSAGEKELVAEKEALAIQKANMALREAELKAKEQEAEDKKKAKESEEAAEKEKQRLAQEAELNRTKGIRFTWAHELSDIKSVPLDWLTLDEAKIKEWLKANKDNLKDGEVYDGVKFFKKMGVSS